MIILGWISIVIGIILTVSGIISYNDAMSAGYGFYRHIDSSDVASSEIMIAIGAILLLIGIVLIIIGYVKKIKKDDKKDILNTKICIKCGYIATSDERFCSKCGNDLLTQGRN